MLVTGGVGFVGSHLVDALVENNDVRVVDDFSTLWLEEGLAALASDGRPPNADRPAERRT